MDGWGSARATAQGWGNGSRLPPPALFTTAGVPVHRCPQLGPTYPPYAPPRSTRAAPSFLPSFSPRPPPPPRPPPAPRRRPPLTTRPLPSSPRIFSLSLFLFRPASLWTSFSFSRYITVQISIPETHRPVGGDADPSCLRAVSLTRARIFGDRFFFLFLFLSLFLFDIRGSFVPIFSTIALPDYVTFFALRLGKKDRDAIPNF